ncbi:MAG: hypothetical protein JKY67_08750 [Pseudomonadales bacterium]|nr:hypothetical protein [Pseudomonadales bacterium]
MKNNYLLHALVISSIAATGLVLGGDSNIIQIERRNGALHQEFVQLIQEQVKLLESGSGRITLTGGSGFRICTADLYISEQTTFVSLNVDSLGYVDEFYIDHPSETFKSILFQNKINAKDSTELNVDRRNGGFTIKLENNSLVIQSRKKTSKSPECRFLLSKAHYFDGETE